ASGARPAAGVNPAQYSAPASSGRPVAKRASWPLDHAAGALCDDSHPGAGAGVTSLSSLDAAAIASRLAGSMGGGARLCAPAPQLSPAWGQSSRARSDPTMVPADLGVLPTDSLLGQPGLPAAAWLSDVSHGTSGGLFDL